MRYTLIRVDGSKEPINPNPSLQRLQSLVGGFVEQVNLFRNGKYVPFRQGWLYVNEDGRRLNLPLNRKATALANERIVGDVVLVEK